MDKRPYVQCSVCRKRNEHVPATHKVQLPSKKGWYVCQKHADALRRTLYGVLTPIVRINQKGEDID